jgi:hypothetical protein
MKWTARLAINASSDRPQVLTGHTTATSLPQASTTASRVQTPFSSQSLSTPTFSPTTSPAMVSLDSRIARAVDLALSLSNPRFYHYLETRGLAALIKTASAERVQDYRAAGELALKQCILTYFIKFHVPWMYRGVSF